MAQSSATASGTSQILAAKWHQFARWWLAGLKDMLSPAWLNWVNGEVMPRLMVRRDEETVVLRLMLATGEIESRLSATGFDAGAIDIWLSQHGRSRDEVAIGAILFSDLFLQRQLSVPKAALEALPRILDQEVIRRTPLALSDIWHAATPVAGGTDDIVAMRHWIIRKDRVEASLADLGMRVSDINFLAAADTRGEIEPVINFRSADDADPSWAIRAVRLLAGAAVVASVVGLSAFEWRQARVASALEIELAGVRQEAQSGRTGTDSVGRLLALKADVTVLQVWEELSRILPDHTFLTELRITDGTVTVSGLSADAARLVRIVDQSPLFSDATLTAAITPVAAEGRDRFSLSFKVRAARPSAAFRSAAP